MKRLVPLILILILVVITVSFALAQQGNLALGRYTFSGGSVMSSQAGHTLQGTAGQVDAGPLMQGNQFAVSGGFWSGIAHRPPDGDYPVYLPLVVR